MDSIELANEVADSFNGIAPTHNGGILIHTIVLRTLEILRDNGYLDLEQLDENDDG